MDRANPIALVQNREVGGRTIERNKMSHQDTAGVGDFYAFWEKEVAAVEEQAGSSDRQLDGTARSQGQKPCRRKDDAQETDDKAQEGKRKSASARSFDEFDVGLAGLLSMLPGTSWREAASAGGKGTNGTETVPVVDLLVASASESAGDLGVDTLGDASSVEMSRSTLAPNVESVSMVPMQGRSSSSANLESGLVVADSMNVAESELLVEGSSVGGTWEPIGISSRGSVTTAMSSKPSYQAAVIEPQFVGSNAESDVVGFSGEVAADSLLDLAEQLAVRSRVNTTRTRVYADNAGKDMFGGRGGHTSALRTAPERVPAEEPVISEIGVDAGREVDGSPVLAISGLEGMASFRSDSRETFLSELLSRMAVSESPNYRRDSASVSLNGLASQTLQQLQVRPKELGEKYLSVSTTAFGEESPLDAVESAKLDLSQLGEVDEPAAQVLSLHEKNVESLRAHNKGSNADSSTSPAVSPEQHENTHVDSDVNDAIEGFADQSSDLRVGNQQPVQIDPSRVNKEAGSVAKRLPSPQEIVDQLVEQVRIGRQSGVDEMHIQLKPDWLGEVKIKIAVENGRVAAHFVAESQTVKSLLESGMSMLQENLESQGFSLAEFTVDVSNGQTFGNTPGFSGDGQMAYQPSGWTPKGLSRTTTGVQGIGGDLGYVESDAVADHVVDSLVDYLV